MPRHQASEVEPRNGAILHHPTALHHHPLGPMRAAEHQGGQRVASAGEAEFVEAEEGEIRLRACLLYTSDAADE